MSRIGPARLLLREVEFRSSGGDGRSLEGYAAVFGQTTRIDSWEGKFDEMIAPGAFAKTISERMPVIQFDHGRDARTGTVPIGSIAELREDKTGLYVRADLYDNAVVEPIRQAIAGRSISGMSFRFRVVREHWDKKQAPPLRTIREAELFELGPVVFPAYEGTSVGVRGTCAAGLTPDQRRRALDLLDAGMIRR